MSEDTINVEIKYPKSQVLKISEDLDLGSVWRVAGKEYDLDYKKYYIVLCRVDGVEERYYVGSTNE